MKQTMAEPDRPEGVNRGRSGITERTFSEKQDVLRQWCGDKGLIRFEWKNEKYEVEVDIGGERHRFDMSVYDLAQMMISLSVAERNSVFGRPPFL